VTLLIADISSHNAVSSWPAFLGSVDGVICKATEGTGYAWAGLGSALTQIRNAGKLVGAYHYAGSSGTGAQCYDPVSEADWFLSHYMHKPGEVIVLDFEPTHPPADPDGWVSTWCQRVTAKTDVTPMLYMNHYAATGNAWTKTRALGCGMWAAWYGADTGVPLSGMPSFSPWAQSMWQYTSKGTRPGCSFPLDLSQFYGDANAWRAYGNPGGADMPLTDADINAIALAVWGFKTSGGTVQAQDRLTGDDAYQLPNLKTELDAVKAELDAIKTALAAGGGGAMPAACAMQGAVLAVKPNA
jgi:GH25 family lysozyme M1 (1,4-beta-N-acetylmuramidase)